MQIREVVGLNEGILDGIKSAAMGYLDPVGTAQQQRDQYIKQGKQIGAEVLAKLDAQTRKKAEELAAEWIASQGPATVATPGGSATKSSSEVTVKTPAGNVVKGADGKWKTSAGEIITRPADVQELERLAKQQATIAGQNKQMSPASGIREAVTDTTSPGGIVIPAGSKTATAPADPAGYDKKFVDWANKKLTSKESSTGASINLDTVMKDPETAADLQSSLKSVVASKDNPQSLKQTVTDFLVKAMKGMQQAAQKIRGTSTSGATTSNRADTVELNKGQQLAKNIGLDLNKLKQLAGIEATRATGNPAIDSILTAAGVIR